MPFADGGDKTLQEMGGDGDIPVQKEHDITLGKIGPYRPSYVIPKRTRKFVYLTL
jgi:hypothetical protein